MKILTVLVASCALAACSGAFDTESRLCESATEGLTLEDLAHCKRDLAISRQNAWNDALTAYRAKPRERLK